MRKSLVALSICCTLAVSPPSLAAKNIPVFDLVFTPTGNVGVAGPALGSQVQQTPLRLRIVDGRQAPDPAVIGSRTDDDDNPYVLKARNEVLPIVEQALARLARDWGVSLSDSSPLTLEIRLVAFAVVETNQAVGASFEAVARLGGELRDGAGVERWSGTAKGTATRYGKKFSNDNCNEVLSDALLDSFSKLLESQGLLAGWEGKSAPSAATAAAAAPAITPAALLEELQRLRREGFDDATLLSVVKQKVLTAKLGTDDMIAWKKAGIPEEVIRAAIELPVR